MSKERRNAIFSAEDYTVPSFVSPQSHFRSTLPNFKLDFDGTTQLDPINKLKIKPPKQRLLMTLNNKKTVALGQPLKPLVDSPRRKRFERNSLKNSQLEVTMFDME